MGASQRVSRGFHRLALFLAAIPFLVGTVVSLYWAGGPTFTDLTRHKQLVCAHEHIERVKKRLPSSDSPSAEKKRLLTDEEVLAPRSKALRPVIGSMFQQTVRWRIVPTIFCLHPMRQP